MSDKHYLDNKAFTALILTCRTGDASQEQQTQLVAMLRTLAENIVKTFTLVPDVDEAIHECSVLSWMKMHKFDGTKGTAFNYFTAVMRNYLLQARRRNDVQERGRQRYFMHVLQTNPNQFRSDPGRNYESDLNRD